MLPRSYLTVNFALVRRSRQRGPDGSCARGATWAARLLQVANAVGRMIAFVSAPNTRALAEKARGRRVVLAEDFLNASTTITGGHGVDVVLDQLGDDRITDSLRSLAPEGRLLVVCLAAARSPQSRPTVCCLNAVDLVGVGLSASMMREPGLVQNERAMLVPPRVGQVAWTR